MTALNRPTQSDLEALGDQFARDGYVIARRLFGPEDLETIRSEFGKLHQAGGQPGYFEPVPAEESGGDPLKEFPRIMHPHRFNDVGRRYLLDERVRDCLTAILGNPPYAVQSMFYFKPPGSRGQALHQDNFYLLAEPGTCVAAWTAVDDCDTGNGALHVVPGSQDAAIICPETADNKESFTTHFVPVPDGLKAIPVEMKAGDTLFFNGSLIHGSGPNRSKTRFRRSFICHYVTHETEKLHQGYFPVLRFDGSQVALTPNESGGPCGEEWKEVKA
ncbi:MAG: phytanoyl-CoA dioxygenase family protein [Verrucomicrobia bacterium]|nr:MAG: phytanoyl-CoA dioxygenase family protein [Verrucomicrobiota bacterium]